MPEWRKISTEMGAPRCLAFWERKTSDPKPTEADPDRSRDDLLCHPGSPDGSSLCYSPEDLAVGDRSRVSPSVQNVLYAITHRHGPDMPRLPVKIHDGPVCLTLLNVSHLWRNSFVTAETTGEQHGQQCSIPFAFQTILVGSLPEAEACSTVSQFPTRMPSFFTLFTRRIPAARSGLSSPQSAAS